MSTQDTTRLLTDTVDKLSDRESLKGLFHEYCDGDPLPSLHALQDIIEVSRALLFPGYYGRPMVNARTIKYQIGVDVERLHQLLSHQILAGLCFNAQGEEKGEPCEPTHNNSTLSTPHLALRETASTIAARIIAKFPEIRHMLSLDVAAAYEGDPAATGFGEVISCYPVIKALTNYRIAHELCKENVPLIPRMMTELAHSETGIDIHPEATIGEHFTIDHGTGVVIGATCIIGNNVKLYQGVTLGAKSFPLDANGNPIKGIARHPILEDDVVVYSNATILGRITIGRGCVVGANVWVTHDMKPKTKKYKTEKQDKLDIEFDHGTGI